MHAIISSSRSLSLRKIKLKLLSATHWPVADSEDQDQTAQDVQSDLDLNCPITRQKMNSKSN